MSDTNKTQPTPPPSPGAKTAAVPLKKETVRITLRARPGQGLTQPKELTSPVPPAAGVPLSPVGGMTGRVPTAPAPLPAMASKATAPIQLPSAPLPPPAARPATAPVQLPPAPISPPASRTTTYVKLDSVPPPSPSAPRPSAPTGVGAPPRPAVGGPPSAPRPPGAPAAPRPPGAPAAPSAPRPPGMAPTVPLAKAPGAPRPPGAPQGPKMEAGAATVPLAKSPMVAKPPGSGTSPMAKAAGPTQALPKATVQLAKGTQPMNKPAVAASAVKRPAAADEPLYEEKDPEAGLAPLAIVCTVLALGLMALNLLGSDRVFFANPGETSALMVPPPELQKWEQPSNTGDGTHVSTFNTTLKDITRTYE